MSREEAHKILNAELEIEGTYTVRSGDSFDAIAINLGISSSELWELNPEVTDPSRIREGQQLNTITYKPLLSIRTVEEVTMTVAEPKPIQTEENHEMRRSFRRVLQPGRDGESEVTMRITRVNGEKVDETELDRTVITAPLTEIVEVGVL